ncbi:hypothetical protein F5Y02DRAFT_422604 [Annulohypoxylon stygium]|nr:hypothetical protein F5Y02DRAFT_422604 [Annulohypoxylon stygium]
MVRPTATLLAVALYASKAMAAVACPPLLVDNYHLHEAGQNNLGCVSTDDGTMANITKSLGLMSFVPRQDSHYFEEIVCRDVIDLGYTYLSYMVKGPAQAGSVRIELHTRENCIPPFSEIKRTSVYDTFFEGKMIERQIPFEFFGDQGANLMAVSGVRWSEFRDGQDQEFEWSFGDIQLVCDGNVLPSEET